MTQETTPSLNLTCTPHDYDTPTHHPDARMHHPDTLMHHPDVHTHHPDALTHHLCTLTHHPEHFAQNNHSTASSRATDTLITGAGSGIAPAIPLYFSSFMYKNIQMITFVKNTH